MSAAYACEVSTAPPGSFEELWRRLGGLDGLLVTADRDDAVSLDQQQQARRWASKTWQALLALDSYARRAQQGLNRGGFWHHCAQPRPGALVYPVRNLAMSESSITMAAWGRERRLRVPTAVDRSGHAEMQSHIKIAFKGRIAPRIYFLDDTKGTTRKVIVGYIGAHLTNTKTS